MKTRIVEILAPASDTRCPLPEFSSTVQGGFPSPADDYIEKQLDLNELMIQHPAATFYVRVQGDSMKEAGIFSGDILVVDRSVKPAHKKIVIAVINGEFTVKRLLIRGKKFVLQPENLKHKPIVIDEASDFQVWGVVTYVIHKAS